MQVHVYDLDLPLDDLIREAREVVRGWDWDRGAFGHALSLPAYRDLHPSGRYSYENFPCTGLLRRYPAFTEVFNRFECDKVSFRLLRRQPGTSYAWHTDRDKGRGVVRFQVPILSDRAAFLIATDYDDVRELKGTTGRWLTEESFAAFAESNAGHFTRQWLQPGILHYFDTSRVHTLVNAGREERITLVFDLLANDWLRQRFPEIRAEAGDASLPPVHPPGPFRMALQYARSGLYPLRNSARVWKTRAGLRS